MIVTEMKPIAAIKSSLDRADRICLVSCNACARKCHTGGLEGMAELSEALRMEGFQVVGENLVGTGCGERQLTALNFRGDTAVVLGCDASISAMERLYPDMKIVPALNTLGLGRWDQEEKVTLVKVFD